MERTKEQKDAIMLFARKVFQNTVSSEIVNFNKKMINSNKKSIRDAFEDMFCYGFLMRDIGGELQEVNSNEAVPKEIQN